MPSFPERKNGSIWHFTQNASSHHSTSCVGCIESSFKEPDPASVCRRASGIQTRKTHEPHTNKTPCPASNKRSANGGKLIVWKYQGCLPSCALYRANTALRTSTAAKCLGPWNNEDNSIFQDITRGVDSDGVILRIETSSYAIAKLRILCLSSGSPSLLFMAAEIYGPHLITRGQLQTVVGFYSWGAVTWGFFGFLRSRKCRGDIVQVFLA